MKKLEFKPLPHDGLGDKYLISNTGNVLSLYDNKGRKRSEPKIRKTQIQPNGYERCYVSSSLGHKKICGRVWIHQMVCLAFNGERPSGLHVVAHVDGNKLNNNASNLRWATRKENEADKKIHGTALTRDKNHQTKIDSRMQKAIVYLNKQHNLTMAELAVVFDVSYQAVGHALKTFIEEIVKEPELCKHEPLKPVRIDGSSTCTKCNIELQATWSEKK